MRRAVGTTDDKLVMLMIVGHALSGGAASTRNEASKLPARL